MSMLNIYRASAGSGKTFRLTRRYLEKALADPQNFSRIAALTFTNKATAEMKARIFETLTQIAKGEEKKHTGYLTESMNLRPEELRYRAEYLRKRLLSEYKDFTVTTLDKFFQRILRAFAREINVDSGFEPELDYGLVLDEIIRNLTDELSAESPVTLWITQYLLEQTEEGKSRDYASAVRGLGNRIFQEDFRAIAHRLSDMENPFETMGAFKNSLRAKQDALTETLRDIGTEGLGIMQRHHLMPSDFKGGSRSALYHFEAWAKGTFKKPTDTFLKIADNAEEAYTKSSERKDDILACHQNGLSECMKRAMHFFGAPYREYLSLEAAGKNLFVFGIFSELLKKLQDYREENNVLLLSDAVDILRGLTQSDDTPFVYEKTGTRYDTYLLDEFQDTSSFQWDCTAPLITDSLANGNDNLIVGDPKQAIYRWRGGDRELINSKVPASFPNHHIHNLNTNWRSRKNIIRFNNTVFTLLLSEIQNGLTAEFPDNPEIETSLQMLHQTYSDVIQRWSGAEDGGFVNMRFLEPPKNEEEGEDAPDVEKTLIETVKSLQDRGFRAKDIAILVRKNAQAKEAADILHAEALRNPESRYVFDVISDEASYLSNSHALNLLISAARFLVRPEDIINNTTLLLEINRQSDTPVNPEMLFEAAKKVDQMWDFLPKSFLEERSTLFREAPGTLFDRLIYLFGLDRRSEEFSYLAAFRDLVTEYSFRHEADLNGFLNHWNEKGSASSVKAPEDADAIRIMTYHKCKGLEFEAVIIPFFHEPTDHAHFHKVTLWVTADEEPYNLLPYFPVNYGKNLADTRFSADYFRERTEALSDALNLAYVAFTRAKSEMYIFGLKPDENEKPKSPLSTLNLLLYHLAKNRPNIPDGENYIPVFTAQDEEPGLKAGEPLSKKEEIEPESVKSQTHTFLTHPPGSRIRLAPKEWKGGYSEERRRGIALHEVLSRLNGLDTAEYVLKQMAGAGRLEPRDLEYLQSALAQFSIHSDVQKLFSAEAEILTETALIGENGTISIPDRIALLNGDVWIGDFKTGVADAGHETQMHHYMKLMSEMGYSRVTGLILYTSTGIIKPIHP
jgi:ATP-dependent exoDNAse (exonuclease V) beta subunit